MIEKNDSWSLYDLENVKYTRPVSEIRFQDPDLQLDHVYISNVIYISELKGRALQTLFLCPEKRVFSDSMVHLLPPFKVHVSWFKFHKSSSTSRQDVTVKAEVNSSISHEMHANLSSQI